MVKHRTRSICVALSLAIFFLFSTVSVAQAGVGQAASVLTITSPEAIVVGEKSTITAYLSSKTAARVKPVAEAGIYLYVDDTLEQRIRTNEFGFSSFLIGRELTVGIHTVRVVYKGSGWLFPSQATTTLVVKPAMVEIQTVPPLAGVRFSLGNHIFTSNEMGVARVDVYQAGLYQLEVLPGNAANSDVRAEFVRWEDEIFSSSREIKVPLRRILKVGLNVSYRAGQVFVDLNGQPVNASRITSLTLKGSDGVKYTFKDGQAKWLPSGRIVERIYGIEEAKILYSIVNVEIDGSNAVIEAEQRFSMTQPNDVWPIKVRLYSAHFTAYDALFHFPIGSGIQLQYPDNRNVELLFGHRATLKLESLAPGLYHVRVVGAGGIAPPTPLAMSRNQNVELLVLSYLDLAVMLGLAVSLAVGVLFFGRPQLVTVLVTRPSLAFSWLVLKTLRRAGIGMPWSVKRYPSDLSDKEWALLAPLLPPAKRRRRKQTVDKREVMNAFLYLERTGCPWRKLPQHFPKWQTVYSYYQTWQEDGTWQRINDVLHSESIRNRDPFQAQHRQLVARLIDQP